MADNQERLPDLLVYLHSELIGEISRSGKNGGRLLYHRTSTPLSTSMPITRTRYPMNVVRPWLEGLLPDQQQLLRQWRREFAVTDDHPISLLRHVGEEVAGAAQFIRPDRVQQALAPGVLHHLTEGEIADCLRASMAERPEVDRITNTGRFSLAGARAKIALLLDEHGWQLPTGLIPTTHIIKPAIPKLTNQEAGEHIAMTAASALDLLTAKSFTGAFEDIPVIILERYDRVKTPKGWVRVHQEDLAQALGVPPSRKPASIRPKAGPHRYKLPTTFEV